MVASCALLCNQLLMQARKDRMRGWKPFFQEWGIDEDAAQVLDFIDALDVDEVCRIYATRFLEKAGSAGSINVNALLRLCQTRRDENKLQDQFLLSGASNSLMKDLFNLSKNICSYRRRMLGIEATCGKDRGCPQDPADILAPWMDAASERDLRKRYLIVQAETGYSLAIIHRVITAATNQRDPLLFNRQDNNQVRSVA